MRNAGKFVVLQLLRAYRWAISPLFPPACRYVPSCSEYAMEAVERYGVLRGGFMALVRLLRCHPFVRGGYDPVVKAGADSAGLKLGGVFVDSRGAEAPLFHDCSAQHLERNA